MSNFYYRTESIKRNDLISLFVEGQMERSIIDTFKTKSHAVLEGSRGSGKSFLMKVAQAELSENYNEDKILPVYITFMQSTLIHSPTANQFHFWMMAKIIRETLKALRKNGLTVSSYANSLLGDFEDNKLQKLISDFESSYKSPDQRIDSSEIPELSDLNDAIEEICEENGVKYISYFFDESAHVFRPEQQRQFFTLFRDFKSPYISCNAAVYPGVTHYGDSFEMAHDAKYLRIERDIKSDTYLSDMKDMVLKQGGAEWQRKIETQMSLFNTLAMCAGGNPRLLLKTLDDCEKINTSTVNTVIRTFYRSEIWNEHTQLGEKYKGHKALIDWGRKFIEDKVIPTISKKNSERLERSNQESSLYFWIHKDVPEQIKEALRLLCYTGIIRKYDSGVKATKSAIGDRYEVKFGCLLAQESSPTNVSKSIIDNLKLDFFTEYGSGNSAYSDLSVNDLADFSNQEFLDNLREQLKKLVSRLDLTNWQKGKLAEINIITVGELLNTEEDYLIDKLHNIGPVRARIIKNSATAELLESISG
ncbi:MAG: hypothetical protein ACJASQ_000723 [Crocinitomicaceae bacterium]|jgi:hypothetical protein